MPSILITPTSLSCFFSLFLFVSISCQHESSISEDIKDDNCYAQLTNNNPDFVGAWEIAALTDVETGITTDTDGMEVGFMLNDYYCNALELRENKDFALYYSWVGRFCEDRIDGQWEYRNDSLFFGLHIERGMRVLSLGLDTLIIQDQIQFKQQIAKMFRANN